MEAALRGRNPRDRPQTMRAPTGRGESSRRCRGAHRILDFPGVPDGPDGRPTPPAMNLRIAVAMQPELVL